VALANHQLGPTPAEFGELVRRLRDEQSLSVEDLAELSGLSPAALDEIEHGRRWVEFDELFALAQGLGTSVSGIFRVWESTPRASG
jgi:transcriptional regulator with XRE-family HTH domain